MSRKPNTEQRRAEIVAAMLPVIANHGYEKATIQEIAKRAELAPGLIHYHFKDKREILVALVNVLSERLRQRYLELARGAQTSEQRLKAYIEARLGLGKGASADAVAAWVVVGSEAIRQAAVRDAYQSAIALELELLHELLTAYFTERGKAVKHVPKLAAALLAFMEGSFQLSSAARSVMPKGYAAETALLLIERFVAQEE